MKKSTSAFFLMLSGIFISIQGTSSMAVAGDSSQKMKNIERIVQTDAWESISPCDAYGYCRTIASEPFAGRLTGHEGYTMAAKWAAGKFMEWGLTPVRGLESFLQEYPSPYTVIDSASVSLFLPGGRGEKADTLRLEPSDDFLPQLFSGSGSAEGDIVFAGWGISAPGLGYDDYEGIDVSGRFVVCFRGTPDREDKRFEDHDQHRTRMRTARDRGAIGLGYIYDDPIANPNGDWLEGFMSLIISEESADSIFSLNGLTSSELRTQLGKTGRPNSFETGARMACRIDSRHFPKGTGYNIVGYVEGSDPSMSSECVVVGGHFDHCGKHMGMIFPGANDNGSGSAVVMEIAQAFPMLDRRPGRSVIFVLFGGEEKGLEGSNWFMDHLPEQFDRVHVMLNFDMNGEGDGANCGYSAEPPGLDEFLLSADQVTGALRRKWKIEHVGVRSSDYAPFFLRGAGCIAFFSNGPHLHYHKTGDTIYRINPEIMADIARMGFMSAYLSADM